MVEVLPKEIGRDDIRGLVRRGAQLVDVRLREAYDRVHLAGATSIPLSMISRNTADRLAWDKPVIVYSENSLDDRSARAAWRLSSLGFTQIYRYIGGKGDWLANGLPVEGTEAGVDAAADLADMDVPTCTRMERVGEVRARVEAEGKHDCVVINDQMTAMGLLRKNDLEKADQRWTAEEAMDRDPLAYRLDATIEEVIAGMEKSFVTSALVTTPDGRLFGLLRREEIQ